MRTYLCVLTESDMNSRLNCAYCSPLWRTMYFVALCSQRHTQKGDPLPEPPFFCGACLQYYLQRCPTAVPAPTADSSLVNEGHSVDYSCCPCGLCVTQSDVYPAVTMFANNTWFSPYSTPTKYNVPAGIQERVLVVFLKYGLAADRQPYQAVYVFR